MTLWFIIVVSPQHWISQLCVAPYFPTDYNRATTSVLYVLLKKTLYKSSYKSYKKSVFKSEGQFGKILNWNKYITQFIYLENCFPKPVLKKRKKSVHYWAHCYIEGGWCYNSDCYKCYSTHSATGRRKKCTRFAGTYVKNMLLVSLIL